MSFNTVAILRDLNGAPIPQGYSPSADAYKAAAVRQVATAPEEWAANSVAWGKTAGGVYVPLQVDAGGVVQTALTGRKLAVEIGEYSQVLSVAATSGTALITITPPVGELWRLRTLTLWVVTPTGATTGSHSVQVRAGVNDSDYNILLANTAFGTTIEIAGNYIKAATVEKRPTTEQAQQMAILSAVVTNAKPLYFLYTNNTDVIQTNTLTIKVAREVEYLAS